MSATVVAYMARLSYVKVSGSRTFRSTPCVYFKKKKHPYDNRFPIAMKDIGQHRTGGSKKISAKIGHGHGRAQLQGYITPSGRFYKMKEIRPELVVPDLTGFKLKPYVSFQVPDVILSEFTAQDLFNACYSNDVINDFRKGKLKDNEAHLQKDKTS